ncbi:ribose-5-phosphate isomerase RpiA [Methanobacterium alcaliphilum]|uniref:ribose-5-phosphate isomerase RpiA n=1 Tax=Methanobacterium alcaliphilum TaxID=392018 RepID=UPI00200B0431|nr:ribose-5-phosphate isomerase RpiA [Methanobacterium alcaliphilum]MCK9152589.1 ribose-5-phosphate isomerase RpiA [Methanobacterium alcaliphilum]
MNLKKMAGYEAAKEVKDGQIVGLGTGSTTHYFIEKLGIMIKEEGLEIMGIPTSYQSFFLAKNCNIPITTLEEHDLDIAVDGADEVDPALNLIKGGGAAHTLEKIVDYSANQFIVIVDDSKIVETLGKFPVPVEVVPQSLRTVTKKLEDMGGIPKIRMAERKDGPVITDNGNFVIDTDFGLLKNPSQLEIELNSIPGVLENGIFCNATNNVIVGTPDGIKRI